MSSHMLVESELFDVNKLRCVGELEELSLVLKFSSIKCKQCSVILPFL